MGQKNQTDEQLRETKMKTRRGGAGVKERVFSRVRVSVFFSFESVKITPLQDDPPFTDFCRLLQSIFRVSKLVPQLFQSITW